ncbi:MAG: hypothetical protein SGBAC_010323 [Bacillariaceae sp.]
MTGASIISKKRGPQRKRVPFPQRLFQLLKLVEENGWEDIISWVDKGTGFKVHDREKFEKVLLDKYFSTTRYASFARQLHAYDFNCVRTGRQTGIYSHPNFRRNQEETSCSLKREATKAKSKTAISKNSCKQTSPIQTKSQVFSLGIRAGDTIVQFPSLLKPNMNNGESFNTQSIQTINTANSNQPSLIAGLYSVAYNRIVDQTRRTLIRTPSECSDDPLSASDDAFFSVSGIRKMHTKGRGQDLSTNSKIMNNKIHTNTVKDDASDSMAMVAEEDNSLFKGDDSEPIPWSPANSANDDENNSIEHCMRELHETAATNMNTSTLYDDDFYSMPLVAEEDYDFVKDDDSELVPWSPLEPPADSEPHSMKNPNQLAPYLEPRPIHEMVQNPGSLNEWWYESTPMFGTPRKRAILEFSLPISLPLGFYLMDVSTYGICCVTFLIFGHFVECLFTSWGGAKDKKDKAYTRDLSFRPIIGMLQHHIMDLLWFHALLSNMILTPDYFGPPCFLLLYLFMWPQPFNLCIVIKTHYCESNLEGTYAHGKWWIGDLIKNVLLGYAVTLLGVFLLHYYGMAFLRIPLVFGFNMIPLCAFESYRYLLSISAVAVLTSQAPMDKKVQ